MRTALGLLNEITGLGYDQHKTLIYIDKKLDKVLGIEERKPLANETLSDAIYDDILVTFVEQNGLK
ncbi:hypothetical protein Ami103574_10265 [Aminipila butyrica]|uniref:Uncharacterized protein n=1 Tax=Aminipila butyrica TaxID=433296 RepID=A0A858BUG0_9FIRM|nr:hypothetical protein [Aminipila butyrica]QIB69681.1 hypothetical protein Ami103574_10265 [Aminipila butyrica]